MEAKPVVYSSFKPKTPVPGQTSTLQQREGRKGSGSTFKKTGGGRRKKPGGPDAGGVWREQVLKLWYPDVEPGTPLDQVLDPLGHPLGLDWQSHHILEAQAMWHHRILELVVGVMDRHTGEIVEALAAWHPFIGMPLNKTLSHAPFTNGKLIIPRSVIPQRAWDFCEIADTLDPLAGPGWATATLERDYPEARG